MKVLFWGTPAYAVPTLEALVRAGHGVVGVVTQPDRRRGRGKSLQPSPVKQRALDLGLPAITPERIRNQPQLQAELADLEAEISVVVAFGQILPRTVLDQPPLGCWNGHGSMLPRWRGAGPIQWSLLSGDRSTGVGVMAMEEGLDTGPVLLQRELAISLRDTAESLATRLSGLTAELMVEALPLIEAAGSGSEQDRWRRLGVTPQEQLAGEQCYARMLNKQDHLLDWNRSALDLHRQVMGLYPNAFTSWQNKRLKIRLSEPLVERLKDELSEDCRHLLGQWQPGADPAGTVLALDDSLGMIVSTSGCPLLIREAQLEGKASAAGQVLLQQLQVRVGDRFNQDESTAAN
ncbi:MAG: methionyl-tRNA formyltransferase [Prochlorococcus sp.]|nr:methionyl-tRNA formyltransferase [Prochlorococcaceae cyanobacterium Fu_MAG_50]